MQTLGTRIRAKREAKGLSIDMAALIIGVTAEDWQAFEADKIEPGAREGLAICGLFGIKVQWLIGLYAVSARRIRESREKAGLSVSDVYHKLQCRPEEVESWESGWMEPDAEFGLRLAKLLNVDPYWLFNQQDSAVSA